MPHQHASTVGTGLHTNTITTCMILHGQCNTNKMFGNKFLVRNRPIISAASLYFFGIFLFDLCTAEWISGDELVKIVKDD